MTAMQAARLLRLDDDEALAVDDKVLRSSHHHCTDQAALQVVAVQTCGRGWCWLREWCVQKRGQREHGAA